MSRTIARPFRVPLAERCAPGDWIVESPEQRLAGYLPDWDYQKDTVLCRTLEIDLAGIRADCGLSKDGGVRISAGYHCQSTMCREAIRPFVLPLEDDRRRVDLTIRVTGSEIARDLDLFTEVLLDTRGSSTGPLVPRRSGTRLWSDTARVRVEGSGPRFPIELVSFQEVGFPGRAGWVLDWGSRDFNRPVLGAIRLLVNSDHEAIAEAVTDPAGSDPSAAIASAIRYDVGRRLIFSALESKEFLESVGQFEPETVGAAIQDLITLHWKGTEIPALAAEAREEPESVERDIQAALGIFGD